MGFYKYYKNITGSTIFISDFNVFLKPGEIIDISIFPIDSINKSVQLSLLVSQNKLVPVGEEKVDFQINMLSSSNFSQQSNNVSIDVDKLSKEIATQVVDYVINELSLHVRKEGYNSPTGVSSKEENKEAETLEQEVQKVLVENVADVVSKISAKLVSQSKEEVVEEDVSNIINKAKDNL